MKQQMIRLAAAALMATTAICFSGCSDYSGSVQDNQIDQNETSSVSVDKQADTDSVEQKDIPSLSDPTPDSQGQTINGILVYNGIAYELFGGGESLAKDYAQVISDIKTHLGEKIKVYNVLVPTHCGITLPDKFKDRVSSQKDYINTILQSYSADVTGVSTYDTLMYHRDEYLYFNTDHHWTGRAAYYAYTDFCKAAKVKAIPMEKMQSYKIEDYYGSLADNINDHSLLTADYVEYFTVEDDIDTTRYDENAENPQDHLLMHTYAEGVNAYGVFLGGDEPLIVTKNANGNGKKIAVVKESYGNAFAPFIAYTYSEAHIMDFRDMNFDFKQYLEDNEIDEVIFINNTMASASPERVEELKALAGE